MFLNEEMYITASESYNDLEFQPMKALNNEIGPTEKYGGFKDAEQDFILEIIFVKPIRIDGYGLKMADEGLNPAEWSVIVDEKEEKEVIISYVSDRKQYGVWEESKTMYDKSYLIEKLTLKVHKIY